jgi:PKD repeat protein
MSRALASSIALLALGLVLYPALGSASAHYPTALFNETHASLQSVANRSYATISPNSYHSTSLAAVEKRFKVSIALHDFLSVFYYTDLNISVFPPRDASGELFYKVNEDSISPANCLWASDIHGIRCRVSSSELEEEDGSEDFDISFTATTKENPPNIVRNELWNIEYSVAGNIIFSEQLPVEVKPPQARISQPHQNQTVSGNVNLLAKKHKGVPAYVEFYADSVLVGSAERGADDKYSLVWDSSTVGDGAHELMAVGCDIEGACESGGHRVTVNTENGQAAQAEQALNEPPAVSIISPPSGSLFETSQQIPFVGEATDPENGPMSFLWDFGDGALDNALETTHSYAQAGDYNVVLTATDSSGAAGSTSVLVGVREPLPPASPIASIQSPASYVFYKGTPISFSGTILNPVEGDNLSYYWDFGDGATAGGSTASHAYAEAGEFTVTLTVEEEKRGTGTDSVVLSILEPPVNHPPQISRISILLDEGEEPIDYSIADDKPIEFEADEGRAIGFMVTATDPDGDDLAYLWRFGDGITARAQEAKHAYYLGPGEKDGSFLAELTVTDGELSVSKNMAVSVKKTYFTIKFLKPASDPSLLFEKGKEFEVQVEIKDDTGHGLDGLSPRVWVERTGKGPETIKMQGKGHGVYAGAFTPTYFHPNTLVIYAEATATVAGGKRETSTAFPVYLSPAKISISNPFAGKSYTLATLLDELAVGLTYPDGSKVSDATAFGEFSCTDKRFTFASSGGGFRAVLDLAIDERMQDCELVVQAEDPAGNRGEDSFLVPLELDNPLFRLFLVKPDLASNNLFTYSQPVLFVAELQSPRRDALRGVRIVLKAPAINKEVVFSADANTGKYSASLKMPPPESGLDSLPIKIEATGLLSGSKVRAVKNMYLGLGQTVNIEFKYPAEGTTALNPLYKDTLVVALTYPNGDPINYETVEAVLSDGEGQQTIVLSKNTQTGLFEAPLAQELKLGKYVLTLKLAEEVGGNEKAIVVNLFQPFDWVLVIYLLVGLFALFSFVFFVRKSLKERAERIEQLETERENLLGLMKRLRFEYFKRHIGETEYRKRLLEAQQRLSTIEKKLGTPQPKQKPRQKPGLTEGLSKKETREIQQLVERLKEQTSKYSKEEMYLAIVQEGYSPKVAGEVVGRLYNRRVSFD